MPRLIKLPTPDEQAKACADIDAALDTMTGSMRTLTIAAAGATARVTRLTAALKDAKEALSHPKSPDPVGEALAVISDALDVER